MNLILANSGYYYPSDVAGCVAGAYVIGIIIGLAISAVIAGVTAKIASDKGRSGVGWFCLSFFLLGVVALIIILCLPSVSYTPPKKYSTTSTPSPVSHASTSTSPTWVCPRCMRTYSASIKVCPNCGTPKPIPKSNVWTCKKCSTINQGGSFCKNCGSEKPKPVVKTVQSTWLCTKCGTKNDSNFCKNCGTPKNQG